MNREQKIQVRLNAIAGEQRRLNSERASLKAELEQICGPKASYCFLYERARCGPEDNLRCRVINAKSLTEAAGRMARFIERRAERYGWEDPGVDYEVDFDGKWLDLYKLGDKHPIYQYLP